jgi:hypothetical protein
MVRMERRRALHGSLDDMPARPCEEKAAAQGDLETSFWRLTRFFGISSGSVLDETTACPLRIHPMTAKHLMENRTD